MGRHSTGLDSAISGLPGTCSHGVSFQEDCLQCEKFDLVRRLEWMEPQVQKDRKRLAEINSRLEKQTTGYSGENDEP